MNADVEDLLALEPLDEALSNRQQRRAVHRRMFRDMVKGELEAGPLTWLRRRTLVKFGERLEIDRFEAQLLIRGVEYEGALIPPSAMPSSLAPVDTDADVQQDTASIVRWIAILLLMVMNYLLFRHGGGSSL